MTDFNSEDQICVWLCVCLCPSLIDRRGLIQSDTPQTVSQSNGTGGGSYASTQLHSHMVGGGWHHRWSEPTPRVKYKSSGREETLLPGHLRHWSQDVNIRWKIYIYIYIITLGYYSHVIINLTTVICRHLNWVLCFLSIRIIVSKDRHTADCRGLLLWKVQKQWVVAESKFPVV